LIKLTGWINLKHVYIICQPIKDQLRLITGPIIYIYLELDLICTSDEGYLPARSIGFWQKRRSLRWFINLDLLAGDDKILK